LCIYDCVTCKLTFKQDYANGYTFSDGYGYVLVSSNYWVPYYYAGSKLYSVCGFSV
jgi:hypothetical protein